MKKENVRFIIKKVLAFFLAVVLGFQIGIMPVQAAALSENLQLSTEIKDDENSTTIKDSESVETNTEKEAVTIIESSSEKTQSTGFDEQKESQDAKSEEKAIFNKKSQENSLEEISIEDENSIDENSLKEKQYKDLTKEQIDIAKRMDLGETYIYNLQKINYKSGDKIDISSIEIITKDKAGNVDLLSYSDLVNNKNIKMNLHQGDEILPAYYNDLFDNEYLKYETEDTKEDISNYLKENNIKEYKPSLTIKIQNFEPINIEFNLEEELDLSPLELFHALKMENSSMRLLTSEGLTIKDNQNIKLDGFRFVIKDEKGLLKVISGKELEKESIKVDFSKLNEDKKSLKDDFIQSYIILQKEGFEKLYIPITILSDNIDTKSISGNSNIDFIVLNQEKNENNIILNSIIDVKDIKDVKSFNVEFFKENGTSENSKIKILKVIKTNGYNEEDILLDMPHSRDASKQQKYKDSSKFEISKKLKNLATSNSILFSNNFEVGYKYLITLEIAGADKSSELITKIALDKFDYENMKTEEIQHNTKLESVLVPNAKINDSLQVRSFRIPNLLATRATNYGEFTLNKVDAEDNTKLSNAKFTLTNSSGISNIFTTDKNGQINISNLEPDTYRLRETQAPEGYIGSLKEWSIYVNSLGRTFITELGEIAPGSGTGSDLGVIVGQDVTSKIQLMGNIGYTDQNNNGQLNMGTDENNITISMNMIIDGPVNPGDYFTIKESDSLHYNMLQPDRRTYPTIVDKSGLVLAYPTFSPDFDIENGLNKEITYVFTEAVAGNNLTELTMTWVHSVNVNIVSYNGMYNFGVTIGENSIATDIRVAHTSPFNGALENSKVNIKAAYLYTNDTNGKYTQIAYINPLKSDVRGASNLIIYPGDSNDKFNMADVQEGKTKITLYKFRDGVSIPDAVIFDKTKLELVSEDQYRISFLQGASVNAAKLDFNNEIGTSTYLVMVESEMRYPNTGTNIDTKVTQFIDYTTIYNRVRDFVNYGNTYNTNVSGGSGGGLSDYEAPILDIPNIKRDVTGKFEIIKVGESSDVLLPKARFTLTPTDPLGNIIIKESGDNGKLVFDNLKAGVYKLEESEAPEGYKKTDKIWTVTVDKNGVTRVEENASNIEPTRFTTTHVLTNSNSNLGITEISPLRVNFNTNMSSIMSLPIGTNDSNIQITGSNQSYDRSTVSTSAIYRGNDEFEVTVKVLAGEDIISPGQDTDLVILIPGYDLTDDIKNSLIEKLNSYGSNVRVALKIYNKDANLDKTVSFTSSQAIANEIRNYAKQAYAPNSIVVRNALNSANTFFNSARQSAKKELISIIDIGVNPNDSGIKLQATNLRNKQVSIHNYYVGNPNGSYAPISYWNRVLGIDNTVDATINAQNVLNNNLPIFGNQIKKAVENATLKVSFNNDFSFVGQSVQTSKPGSNQWHSGYNLATNSIDLRDGELTLNANENATMTFRVKSNSTIVAEKEYQLINPIIYRPNSDVGEIIIDGPEILVLDNKINVIVENTHSGASNNESIEFTLKRGIPVENGIFGNVSLIEDTSFSQKARILINGSKEFIGLDKKDNSGNFYQYYIADVKSDSNRVIVSNSSGIVSQVNGTITISTKENKGFNVRVDWQGLHPVGEISGSTNDGIQFRLDSSNDYFFENLNADITKINSISVNGPDGYNYLVEGKDGSYVVKVSMKTQVSSITVSNSKYEPTAQLVIKKTDEGGNINLKGATFTLTDSYGKVVEQTTGEDGKTTFGGLKVGKYELVEIKAPSGYEKVEGTWEVTVTDDGKALSVIVKEPESTKINTTYDISNKKGERLYYYNDPLLDLQTTIEQIEGTDRFIVNVLYKGRALYNSPYNLTILFDIENFEILSNNVNNGRFVATILSGESNPSGVYSFTVKPKNPQDNVTLTPINSIDYNNLYLSSFRYPTITPRLGQAGVQTTTLSPIEGSTSVFEYSIANKSGKDKFSLIKKDINGNPLQGVEFELLGSDREVIRKETTDSEGRIVFDNLSYGQYWFRETKTLPGYILDDTLIPVLLGKDWKVPINPQNPKDVSDAITIDTNKTNSMTTTTGDKYTVYPNKTEGLIIGVNFTVDQNQIINPGDTFTIKLNENVDLDGIGNTDDKHFDIFASSGLIAKAKIAADRRSIEYTFTEYVKYNELKGFKVNIPMFIDRIAIKNNTNNVPISIQIGDETNTGGKFEDSISVDYENYISDPETVKTYIIKNNQESGTFTALLYVNPQNYKNFNRYLEFTSNQLIDIDNIEVYYSPNGGGSESLPWSYGIDNTKLNKINNPDYYYNQNAKLVSFNLGKDASTNAYVIKIEGRFDNKANEFITDSYYYRDLEFFDYWGRRYFERYLDKWQTFVKFYYPDSSVEGQVLFNIVNIKNKIEYIKVEGNIINAIPQDSSDNVVYANDTKDSSLIRLMGAKFQLKFEKDGAWENYGEEITSDGSGKFSWEGLPSGKYQVWETQAPEGYITPKDYVSSFIVDERGNITDILNNTTIIPNEKESMKFFIDKIWQDEQKNNHSIVNGTLELEITAPQGTTFPDDIKVDQENSHIIDRKYKITKISDDNRTITIEIDLKTAYEGVNSVTDETKAIKIIVPTNWPSGDYILKETKAPIGYIMGMERYTLSVDWNNKIIKYGDTVLYSKDGDNEIFKVLNIVNERGKYPSTGGFGTAIYTLIGFALMGIAFIEYKRKKVINST